MSSGDNKSVFTPAVMPDGKLAPSLMTEAELILYLRLDKQKADAVQTLRYYRELKKLKATKIGKNLLYSRRAADDFIDAMTN